MAACFVATLWVDGGLREYELGHHGSLGYAIYGANTLNDSDVPKFEAVYRASVYLGKMNDSFECEIMALFQCTLAMLSLMHFKRVTLVDGYVCFKNEVGVVANKFQHFVDGPVQWLLARA